MEVFQLCECSYKRFCTGTKEDCSYITYLEVQFGQEVAESILAGFEK